MSTNLPELFALIRFDEGQPVVKEHQLIGGHGCEVVLQCTSQASQATQ
jgi:hypothetical protein